MKVPVFLLATALAFCHAAFADVQDMPPSKSLPEAYLWTTAATLIPVTAGVFLMGDHHEDWVRGTGGALVFTGLAIGPSAGQFYAESNGKGINGVLIRITAPIAGIIFFEIMTSLPGGAFGDYEPIPVYGSLAVMGSVYLLGTVYSIKDTWFAVDRANERARTGILSNARLSPALFPTATGRFAPGLVFRTSL